MGKTGIVITARTWSSRLPNKCLQIINGKEALAICIEHCMRQKDHEVFLAIPEDQRDDQILGIAQRYGVRVYRGDDESPLHRIYHAALQFGLSNVVRITADDILIDAGLLLSQVRFHENGDNDYTDMRRLPSGTAGEVIRTSALARIVQEIGDKPVEHITYQILKSEFKFRCREYYPPRDYQNGEGIRLEIDYYEDLQVVRTLFASLSHRKFGTLDIINFMCSPEGRQIREINRMPEITVYTCCYNQGQYINDCLESIANQTYRDFEVVVIDDCSTDDTSARAIRWASNQSDRFRKRIQIYRNEENLGLPASSNKALHRAKGRYVVRVDSDDFMEPDYLEQTKKYLDENKDAGAVLTGCYETDENLENGKAIGPGEHVHPGCCLYRTKLAREVMYRADMEHYEGLEFYKRFKGIYNYGFVDQPLWRYRQHDESKSAIRKKLTEVWKS